MKGQLHECERDSCMKGGVFVRTSVEGTLREGVGRGGGFHLPSLFITLRD